MDWLEILGIDLTQDQIAKLNKEFKAKTNAIVQDRVSRVKLEHDEETKTKLAEYDELKKAEGKRLFDERVNGLSKDMSFKKDMRDKAIRMAEISEDDSDEQITEKLNALKKDFDGVLFESSNIDPFSNINNQLDGKKEDIKDIGIAL